MNKSKSPIFDTDAFLKSVGQGKTVRTLKKNEIIYSQGDAGDHVFYVQKGRVKLNVVSEHGKEAVVGIVEAGQFFGEACLKGQSNRVATTSAMMDTT
jgi:CRP-like cAMP-binding protein